MRRSLSSPVISPVTRPISCFMVAVSHSVFLIGLAVVRIGSIPLTLGSGGGALLSGLLFGWYRSRNMTIGNMPTGASTLLRDLGLAGFVAVVDLNQVCRPCRQLSAAVSPFS